MQNPQNGQTPLPSAQSRRSTPHTWGLSRSNNIVGNRALSSHSTSPKVTGRRGTPLAVDDQVAVVHAHELRRIDGGGRCVVQAVVRLPALPAQPAQARAQTSVQSPGTAAQMQYPSPPCSCKASTYRADMQETWRISVYCATTRAPGRTAGRAGRGSRRRARRWSR